MFDLDAYLDRIGLSGRPALAELHRAHVCAIPFENLDPHRGVPVLLADVALERKLVRARRGGYCFEQNLLFARALESLGHEVELLLARVRWNAAPGSARPRSHLVLRVHADGALWHADVGFGGGTLLEPIPFGPGRAHEQAGWSFRVVQDEEELVLQTDTQDGWKDVYGFHPQAVPLVDLETSNWFTCTHPRSPFVTGLLIARQRSDGSRLTLSDWSDELRLLEETPGERRSVAVPRDRIPQLLETEFGLPGFALDGGGRVTLAAA